MSDLTWRIERRKLSDLKPWSKNPRQISDDNFTRLKKRIKERGFHDVLKLDEVGTVLSGNQRLRALIELGVNEINCIVPNRALTNAEKDKIGLESNINDGETDFDLLQENFDIELLQDVGFSDGELDIEPEEIQEDDVSSLNEVEPIAKFGDIWQLGQHRIICGDCCDVSVLDRLMGDTKATVGFNDPPYGMGKERDGVTNDNLNYDALLDFNKKWISLQFTFLKDNGSFYCWGTDEPLMDIYSQIIKPYIKQQKATFRNIIVWDKGNGQGQNSDNARSYAIVDEKCLFVMLGVQGFNNNADNYFEGWEPIRDYLLQSRLAMGWDVPTMKKIAGHSDLNRDHWTSKSQFRMPTREVYNKLRNEALKQQKDAFKKDYDVLKKDYYSTRAFFDNTHDNFNNVWHCKRELTISSHATPKPQELCCRAIKSSCPEGEIVLDCFLGSGSTLIACEQTNRICYGCEIEPRYIDIIIARWEKFTGQKAVKVS
jgi:DNA modification methylase